MKKLGAHLIILVMMGACSPKAAPPLGEDSPSMAAELPGIAPRSPELRERLAKALLEKGADYKARAHHTLSNGQPRFSNRLILESSPYLLQHAHNPVDWFPWGEEAFEIARREQKPIFLSVGYSTCHWCHVMERESFEDLEVAALINKHFVAIKVDREERPDIDSLYMNAVFMLGSGGGWPMTLVMTPEKQPFFAGTYFPPRDGMRGKSKGLMPILEEIARRYKSDRGELIERAADISRKLVAGAHQNTSGNPIEMEEGSKLVKDWAASMERNFDKENGGFGGAPKFPRPPDIELLLRHYGRTGNAQSLLMAEKTLEAMARGGIFDQIGGGFHRYATDARWLVPHFEKMLYDNAQLGALYTEAFQISQKPIYADIARRSLNYVLLEMTSPGGGFYSATDADSEGVEGKFFVWTPAELQSLLGADTARIVGQAYGVSQAGNFEGKNILHWPKSPAQTALDLKISESELWGILEKARPLLYEARKKRIAPLRDEKIINAHNGLMIGALAQAGFALNEPRFIEASKKAAQFVLGRPFAIKNTTTKNTKNTKRLARNANAAQKSTGYLDDHAYFIHGLLELYKATGDIVYLKEAQALQEEQDTHFWDQKNGGYFHSPDDAETLLAREKPDYDGAEPSGNSVAILNLCKLYWLSQNNRYSQTAERTIAAFSQSLRRSPRALPKMLSALESCVLSQPLEIALVRPEQGDDEGYAALINILRKSFLPHAVMAFAREGEDLEEQSKTIAFLEQKIAKNGRATAYVCRLGACKQPTSDPGVLEKQISDWMRKIASDEAQ